MKFMDFEAFTRDYLHLLGILRWIISPLLVFVSFYFIGKRIDTTRIFWSYLFSFFLGNWAGSTFGFILMFLFADFVNYTNLVFLVTSILSTFLGSLFSYTFFVGFCAMATSYIIKKGRNETEVK